MSSAVYAALQPAPAVKSPCPFPTTALPGLFTSRRDRSDITSTSHDLGVVQRCLGGDGNAYRELVERHQSQVAAMMWRFSRDPEAHEDLVQDVFVEAYASLAKYRGDAPFAHWLAGIATRTGYQYWKRRKRDSALEAEPIEDWETIADESGAELEPEDAGELLHRLLGQLPPRDRLVLTLRYVENRSVDETAELTGWSKVMVKVQALRAKKKLRGLFDRAEEAGL